MPRGGLEPPPHGLGISLLSAWMPGLRFSVAPGAAPDFDPSNRAEARLVDERESSLPSGRSRRTTSRRFHADLLEVNGAAHEALPSFSAYGVARSLALGWPRLRRSIECRYINIVTR
jgi:hypothetical protein